MIWYGVLHCGRAWPRPLVALACNRQLSGGGDFGAVMWCGLWPASPVRAIARYVMATLGGVLWCLWPFSSVQVCCAIAWCEISSIVLSAQWYIAVWIDDIVLKYYVAGCVTTVPWPVAALGGSEIHFLRYSYYCTSSSCHSPPKEYEQKIQQKYMICWQIQYKWIQWIPVPLQLHLWLKPQPACNTKSTQCANKKIFLAALFAGTTFLASNIGSDTWKPNFLANSKSSQKDKSLTLLHICPNGRYWTKS